MDQANNFGPQLNSPSPVAPQPVNSQQVHPHPDDIARGHKAIDVTMDGLVKLVSLPKGELTKKDVFDEASTMIAHGAFPAPEDKQHLIAALANLPEDDPGIRKALGQQLLALSVMRDHYHNAYGAPQ